MKKKNGQGHKPVRQLRFSKSGDPEIEKAYATHYVDGKRITEMKAEQTLQVRNEERNTGASEGDVFPLHS